MEDISLDLYRVFYICARTGNLTKAAEQLHVTQPAISHSIKQLERKMGGPLFSRTSRGVTLTKAGSLLFDYVNQAFQALVIGEKKVAEVRQLLAGEVRIGAGDTLCKNILLPALETYHKDYPDIKLKVINRTTFESLQLLKEGKIDFAVVNMPLEDHQLEVWKIRTIHDCFIAGRNFEYLKDRKVEIEELMTNPLILLEEGSNSRMFISDYFAKSGYTIVPEIELGSHDLLVEFAKIGIGVSCIIEEFVDWEQAPIFKIDLVNPITPREIGIVKLKSVPLSDAAQMFINILEAQESDNDESGPLN